MSIKIVKEAIRQDAIQMCTQQGNVLKCDGNPENFLYKHAPIALTPIPYPVHLYEQALAFETSMGIFFS